MQKGAATMPTLFNNPTRRTLLKNAAVGTASLVLGSSGATADAHLPRTTPESVGISPEAIIAFLDDVDQKVGGLHSFMLLRHGKVAAEGWWAPYAPNLTHMLYSLSKSFTSTAVGMAIREGWLTVDDKVLSFFPSDAPSSPDPNLAAMRVRHLLTMNTGHDKDATGATTAAKDGNWVKAFLALPVEHEPGTKFVYNSAATYMLSAIVQKKTGMPIRDYLTPRLFRPLGIDTPAWDTCPRGINTGGWGLNVKTEDIARFGQLYLQKGKWNEVQIVPAEWVAAATSKQVSNGDGGASDWTQGYGYQFWQCRHGAFRGDGAFGQYCVVMPEQDAVLAITSGVGDMQAVLNAVWDHLLPGMSGSDSGSARLHDRIKGLSVPAPAHAAASTAAARVSAKTYKLESNAQNIESVEFAFDGDRCTATFTAGGVPQDYKAGSTTWEKGSVPRGKRLNSLSSPLEGKIASRGAWTADDTYTMKVCFVESPYAQTITCRFTGDEVEITRKLNVAFGPTDLPRLKGRQV
jgi:CubicO group peptidase (beta-lactamase class C family)